jgi:hypothetical protein
MHVLELSAKVYNYYSYLHECVVLGTIAAIIVSCSNCANCVVCNSRLYYSAAGASNCWDNNIDYCSGRWSMAICKIPFTLAENFVLL